MKVIGICYKCNGDAHHAWGDGVIINPICDSCIPDRKTKLNCMDCGFMASKFPPCGPYCRDCFKANESKRYDDNQDQWLIKRP